MSGKALQLSAASSVRARKSLFSTYSKQPAYESVQPSPQEGSHEVQLPEEMCEGVCTCMAVVGTGR
jgi:hypothetical protein